MSSTHRATANRWFRIWMGAWVLFITLIVATAKSELLTARRLVPTLVVHGCLFALAFWLLRGLDQGRRVGGAVALVAFFAASGLFGAGIIAAIGVDHASPAVLLGLLLGFMVITVRTLVALIVLLGRGQ